MKAKLLTGAFLLFALFSFGKRITIEQAMKTGRNFFYERINIVKPVKYEDIKLHYFSTDKIEDPAYYIFNIGSEEGYVIVSADDATFPVIGYDFKGSFSLTKMPPALSEFMINYAKEINTIRKFNILPSVTTTKKWQELQSENTAKSTNSVMAVNALITAEWNQSFPYNAQAPACITGGDGGHYWVGCVAVAMAQVMKYYNYPQIGTLSATSSASNNGTKDVSSATAPNGTSYTINFAQQTYDWYRMPFTNLSGNLYPDETAKLMFHCGVAVNMNWGPDGSGAFTADVASALKNYFKYDHSITTASKSSYSDASWINLLKGQLDQGKPLVYSGHPPTSGGHAWNCDGYQDDTGSGVHFHMNWGWGGSNNGYFLLTELYTPVSPGQPAESLMEGQNIVMNIFPEANYPEYCVAQRTFTAPTGGNFEDGSGYLNYQNNANCSYLIQPSCGNYIRFNLTEFNIDSLDAVYIYDGATTSDSLLKVFHGGDILSETISSGNKMLIKFITNASVTSKGWKATYSVDYCKYGFIIQAPTGAFDDGSGTCEYRKSSNCSWIIDLPAAQSITLNFTSFNMASDADFVTVYQYDQSAANVIKKYGYQGGAMVAPTAPLTVTANRVVIRFFSNSTVNASGWALNYTSVILPTYTVSGNLNYNNSANTAMANTTVNLISGVTQIATTTTNATGFYSFSNVFNGSYTLTAGTTQTWGGVTAIDILKMKRHIASLEILTEPIRLTAADVNATSSINATDVLKVSRRIASLDFSFTRPDWLFEIPTTGGNSITVNNANVTQNMFALCTGDVNGSYAPALSMKTASSTLNNYSTIKANINETVELPIRISNSAEIGAMQLFLNYPANLIEVLGVTTTTSKDELIFHAENGILRIVWTSLESMILKENDVIVTVKLKGLKSGNFSIKLQPESELADAKGNEISGIELNSPTIELSAVSEIYSTFNIQHSTFNIYPNPATKNILIDYFLNEESDVKISILNLLGEKIETNIYEKQKHGNKHLNFDLKKHQLSDGIYIISFETEKQKLVKRIMVSEK